MSIPHEAIEAAARALCGTPFPDTWEKLGADIQERYRREAEDALAAAYPFMQAEALRDAADAWWMEANPGAKFDAWKWMKDRAATIEPTA